ncbi:MAG: hypothetical protein KDA45_10095, partial [Planctomycetales bacterium]|nr:hypothetical protein [Planctomycetales bacterium]
DRVQPGLKVRVTVDAFPDRSHIGTVKSVAVLPERSYYSDTQKYKTIITVDEDVYQLKPGMTAVCEVNVDYLPSVNAVPLQAVVQRGGQNWLYVRQAAGDVQRRKVTLGPSNDQYVAVNEGVESGELVVLNPAALIDDSEELRDVAPPKATAVASKAAAETLVATSDESAAIN